MRHRLTTSFCSTQCKESCAVAAVYAVLNDGHRSISWLSARSTAARRPMPLGKTKERATQRLWQGLDEVEQLAAGLVL